MDPSITLVSKSGKEYEVKYESMKKSQKIFEGFTENNTRRFEFREVEDTYLEKVIQYCIHHESLPLCNNDWWDEEYIKVNPKGVIGILNAAHVLVVKELVELAMKEIAKIIKGKTPEQIRQTFDIKNDLTQKEEEEIRKKFCELEK